jgi:hypothetical protein
MRDLVVEPTEYAFRLDEVVDKVLDKRLAQIAWNDYQASHADHEYSCHFIRGFLEGYADYLYAGGGGTPPPVPPRPYWRPEFESPEGHQAIQDWFAGFKEGADVARHSGQREQITLPTPGLVPHHEAPPPGYLPPSPPREKPMLPVPNPESDKDDPMEPAPL